ncbi:MAG: PCMD domain-containing protein [Bacteroidales bacterium]|nr:PCMD domain-containing protein [Bacteroidales bacterium]
MKQSLILSLLLATTLFAACTGDEPANAECDIEQCWVHFDNPSDIFFHDYDTLQVVPSSESAIQFLTRYDVEVHEVVVFFTITPGATICQTDEHGNETVMKQNAMGSYSITTDLSNQQVRLFKVISEDGNYSRTYQLCISPKALTQGDLFFDFESFDLDPTGYYYEWKEPTIPSGEWWATANTGFRISVSSAKPEEYPSLPAEGGVDGGHCVKLTTRSTQGFGAMVNMRLAAGNFFVGTFDVTYAMVETLKTTKMGRPYAHKPSKISGYYKYTPGETFQNRNGTPQEGVTDSCDIYLIYYRNIDELGEKVQLDGTNVYSSPHIAGRAAIDKQSLDCTGKEWVHFELPVIYSKEVERADVENELYNLAIVFSSSYKGDYFQGAIGSTLWIDNVTLECEY